MLIKTSYKISSVIYLMIFLSNGLNSFSYASNVKTLDILSLIENKEYLSAARLLEEEIGKTRDQKTKGYYAPFTSSDSRESFHEEIPVRIRLYGCPLG